MFPLIVTFAGVDTPLCVPIAIAPPVLEADVSVIVLFVMVTVALAPSSTLIAPPKEAIALNLCSSIPAPVISLLSITWVPEPTMSIKPPATDILDRVPWLIKFEFFTSLIPFWKQKTPPLIPKLSPKLSMVNLESETFTVLPKDLKKPPVLKPFATLTLTLEISAVTPSLVWIQAPCVPSLSLA